jgi:cytidine deaminase
MDLMRRNYHAVHKAAYDHATNNTQCYHFGCGVFLNGKLQSVRTNNPKCHAEAAALKDIESTHTNAAIDIFVIRVRKNGTPALAKPCWHCLQTLKKHRVRHVYYTDKDGLIRVEHAAQMETDHISGGNLKQV